jgi:hypothetical protein
MLCKMLLNLLFRIPLHTLNTGLTHAEAFIKGVFAELNAKTSTSTRHISRSVLTPVRLHIDYAKDVYKTTTPRIRRRPARRFTGLGCIRA